MRISTLLLVLASRILNRIFQCSLYHMHISMVLLRLLVVLPVLAALLPLQISSVHLLHLLAAPYSFP